MLLLNCAGWRTTDKLHVPRAIALICLPLPSHDLQSAEHISQYVRGNELSNTVIETHDDIIEAACEACNKLTALPDVITSIGLAEWTHIGQ